MRAMQGLRLSDLPMHVSCSAPLQSTPSPLVKLHAQGNIQEPQKFPDIVPVRYYTGKSCATIVTTCSSHIGKTAVAAFVECPSPRPG